jgi:hypothetical protein
MTAGLNRELRELANCFSDERRRSHSQETELISEDGHAFQNQGFNSELNDMAQVNQSGNVRISNP